MRQSPADKDVNTEAEESYIGGGCKLATASEEKPRRMSAKVGIRVTKIAINLYLLVVTSYKCQVTDILQYH